MDKNHLCALKIDGPGPTHINRLNKAELDAIKFDT